MESKKENFLILDFCGTVVDLQTFDIFIKYCLKRERRWIYWIVSNILVEFFFRVISSLTRNNMIRKKFLVLLTMGMEYSKLKKYGSNFYNDILHKRLIEDTMHMIRYFSEKKYSIIIVSAACDLYLGDFAEEINAKKLICTQIEFANGISLGRIKKPDVFGENKKEALVAYINSEGIDVDDMVGITDSISDIPILSLCKRKIVISKNKSQDWITPDMEEIIYASDSRNCKE